MSDMYTHLHSLRLTPRSADAAALRIDNTSGTAKITISTAGAVTLAGAVSLGSTLSVTGAVTLSSALGVAGNLAVNTNKFTVAAASGNTVVAGTLDVSGDFAINTDKLTVSASSGDTAVAGDLTVTGTILGDAKISVLTSADDGKTLTAAESGTIFILDSSGGKIDLALPSPAAGLQYSFIVRDAANESDISAGSNILKGGLVCEAHDAENSYVSMAGSTITMTTNAVIGDRVDIVCDGTYFYVRGHTGLQGAWSVA